MGMLSLNIYLYIAIDTLNIALQNKLILFYSEIQALAFQYVQSTVKNIQREVCAAFSYNGTAHIVLLEGCQYSYSED